MSAVSVELKFCCRCAMQKPAESFYQSRCRDCELARKRTRSPEARRAERQRAAEKAGVQYVSRDELNARLRSQASDRREAARQSKEAEALAARERRVETNPWTAPGLSDADAYRIRYRMDVEFNLKERLRRQANKKIKRDGVAEMIRAAFKTNGTSPTAERLLGYSLGDLRQHLERQFTKRMDWARFRAGEIHIDHIVPQACFDLSNLDEWRRCWCLSNLRPLWGKDNLAKSARRVVLL